MPPHIAARRHILYFILLDELGNDTLGSCKSLGDLCCIAYACHSAVGTSAALTACKSCDLLNDLSCMSALGNSVLAAYAEHLSGSSVIGSQNSHNGRIHILYLIAHGAENIGSCILYAELYYLDAVNVGSLIHDTVKSGSSQLGVKLCLFLFKSLDLGCGSCALCGKLTVICKLESLCGLCNCVLVFLDKLKNACACNSLDTSCACRNGSLGKYLEQTDL